MCAEIISNSCGRTSGKYNSTYRIAASLKSVNNIEKKVSRNFNTGIQDTFK